MKEWKKKNKPAACTQAPWEHLIPREKLYETMRQIRQESIDAYGHSMDECTKRKVCLAKKCMGRPLPWKSDTARPYLEQLRDTQNIQDGELYIETDCSGCPMFKSCTSPCSQVNDYIERDKTLEPPLIYREKTDNIIPADIEMSPANMIVEGADIPWDVLPEHKAQVIKEYLYKGKDFRYIADSLDLNNQARVKYEFYSALTKLSEYAIMRKFLDDNNSLLSDKEYLVLDRLYTDCQPVDQIADELDITSDAIYKIKKRVINKFDIKWAKFVKKQGNKTIYNVPEIFK